MVWPMPASMQQGESFVDLAPSFKVTTTSTSDALAAAIKRYTAIMFAGRAPDANATSADAAVGQLASLSITVTDPSEDLGLETCENYTISVKGGLLAKPEGTLTACTIYGAMHGLETFAQLVRLTDGGYAVPAIEIADGPRFHFRCSPAGAAAGADTNAPDTISSAADLPVSALTLVVRSRRCSWCCRQGAVDRLEPALSTDLSAQGDGRRARLQQDECAAVRRPPTLLPSLPHLAHVLVDTAVVAQAAVTCLRCAAGISLTATPSLTSRRHSQA
jgi:hypothetical protein|eukprot:COSAG06_NODE_9190_length_1962_cov_1.398282_1_plen_275_part_00